jgi:hypothetical protein
MINSNEQSRSYMAETRKKHKVTHGSVDLSKEFNKFIKENKKLLKKLSD